MAAALLKRIEELERKASAVNFIDGTGTVIGLVSPDGRLTKCIRFDGDSYVEVHGAEPQAFFAEKLEPVFTRPKRFIVIIGGRGSGKSIAVGDIGLIEMHDRGVNFMCLRRLPNRR